MPLMSLYQARHAAVLGGLWTVQQSSHRARQADMPGAQITTCAATEGGPLRLATPNWNPVLYSTRPAPAAAPA